MKIGIMTMHRVQNIGSVLQAYALQRAIEKCGCEAELIDYEFPPVYRRGFSMNGLIKGLYAIAIDALKGFSNKKRLSLLSKFRNKYFKCSPDSYDREMINVNPPKYDIYCTGSDQVWNPLHVGKDTSFMLDFIPTWSRCFSYASSFATSSIADTLVPVYKKELSKYDFITVREETGVNLIKQIVGKDSSVVCDPTLLLQPEEWNQIASDSKIQLPSKYILVYLLRYMFDPRPGFYSIVRKVQENLKLPVIYFEGSLSEMLQKKSKVISGVGPSDFIKIVSNASFVITDSFHGTAFASLYNVPMIGVVNDSDIGDSRLASLRHIVGGENSIVRIGSSSSFTLNEDFEKYKCDYSLLLSFQDKSRRMLEMMIDNCK